MTEYRGLSPIDSESVKRKLLDRKFGVERQHALVKLQSGPLARR